MWTKSKSLLYSNILLACHINFVMIKKIKVTYKK